MIYDARTIANWFIQRAHSDDKALSVMSLLKLAYIAHGWRLALRDAPLFRNKIEAWQYGPVVLDIYYTFRDQGLRVTRPARNYPPVKDEEDKDFLEQIYDIYADMPPFRLSGLTHEPGGPWAVATQWGGWYAKIPDVLIRAHYIGKLHKAEQEKPDGG